MRQQKTWFRLFAFLLGLSLFAAACGDDDDDDASTEGDKTEDDGSTEEADPVAALREDGDADPSCENESDGEFKVGGLLAETGDLGDILGAPQAAGAALALKDINDNGGVNGKPVVYEPKDSGDEDPDLVTGAADEHLQAGVDAVLGASASGITAKVIDTVTGECTIMFSPSNTSPGFTTYADDDLYFRTAAADILQGRVLAELAIEEGAETGVILARQDDYGEGLLDYITSGFEDAGGTIDEGILYNPEATEFDAEVEQVVSADSDALFLVGFDESSAILTSLFESGYTPAEKKIYMVEGNMTTAVGEAFTTPSALVGIKGTIPGGEVPDAFRARLLEQDPTLNTFTYGPETYDAVTILALAAVAAETDESSAVAREINGVTVGGTECTDFKSCADLLAQGEDIDYQGQSGPVDFAKPGEPKAANYGIYTWTPENTVNTTDVEFKPTEL